MNKHRTCIICLPRTGSQLCEKLVGEISNAYTLGEFFENWNQYSEYELDNYSNIYIKKHVFSHSPFKLTNNIEERIALLKNINLGQPLSLRIFLMDHYDKIQLSRIVTELKNIGFEFITLVRDLREQLISYMIAKSYEISKNSNVFGINSLINESVTVDIYKLRETLIKIRNSSRHWEKNVSNIFGNTEYQKINYKTIYSDMSAIYDREFKYFGNKSITVDPLDLIVNKKEITDILDILLK